MNVYVVAHTSGSYMYPATKKVFKTEKLFLKSMKRYVNKG